MKNARIQTTSKAIQRRFFSLFIVFAVLLGISIVSVVGFQLVRQSEQQSIQLLSSLKRSIIDDRPDWNQWRKNSTINTANTYVKVYNSKIGTAPDTFYSKGTKRFLSKRSYQLPIFSAVRYVNDYGLVYYRSGSRLGIQSQIWLSLNGVVTILISVLIVTAILMLFGITLGGYFITLSAKQITQPLANLSKAAQAESARAADYASPLPAPQTPVEVAQLANSFNTLLGAVNDKNKQEKTFVSNAAHELRTPIAVILGHSKLIQRRGQDHPEIVTKSVNFITDEATRMQQLVNQLLILSRADRATSERTYINLSNLVFESVEEQRALLSQKISVTGASAAAVLANADNVQQILRTLLDNAGKYSPKDSLIRVHLAQTPDDVTVTVVNAGPQISTEDQAHLFDRFYRGSYARDSRIEGTGLGLAIAKQLANLNQIELTVANAVPSGTQFSLTFKNPQPTSTHLEPETHQKELN